MEHSRLLKFLTEERYRTVMAETPSIKIQREYENPPNISAEVPGEQPIREMDASFKESTVDIQEMENGGHKILYTGVETTMQTDKQTITRSVSTTRSKEVTRRASESEEKNQAGKKSRIPLLKFQQSVQKVQKENQKQKETDKTKNKRRRSSIPKLKDAKAVKRTSSLKLEERVDDEFEKIYEQVVDNKQNLVDDQILTVKVDDPERVETKFEEIIHAYDSNDDNYYTPTEKLKLSKIPWRKKDSAAHKTSALDKKKTTVTTSNLKDGGFRVTTITTKRFSRGNSMDLNKTSMDLSLVSSSSQNPIEDKIITKTTTTEIVTDNPDINKDTDYVVKRSISVDDAKRIEKIEDILNLNDEMMEIEEFAGGRKITKETITRIPIKSERVNRIISRDLNRRPVKLDDKDFINGEIVKHEDLKDGSSKTIIRETIIKEPEIRTEKMTRSINRTFSRDGKSITISSHNRQSYNESIKRESTENNNVETIDQIQNEQNDFKNSNQNVLKSEKHTKESSKLPTPIITKTTHSYIKGSIKNVERSKSVEWKAADEVITKKYSRTYSENKSTKHDTKDKKPEILEGEKDIIVVETLSTDTEDTQQSPVIEIIDDKNDIQVLTNDETPDNISNDTIVTSISKHQEDVDVNSINLENAQTEEASEIKSLISYEEVNETGVVPHKDDRDEDEKLQNVTILKGNVSKLITQLSVQDNTDVIKKDVNVDEGLPKKKSVLSKIALFEGKDATEYTIKVKKCTFDKKPVTLPAVQEIKKSEDPVKDTPLDLDYFNTVHETISSSITDTDKRSDHIPVIVDQIWKYQEDNVPKIHQVQEVNVLPEALDFIISDNHEDFVETNKASLDYISGKLNEVNTEQTRLLPEKLDSRLEHSVEVTKMLPEKINFETNEIESNTESENKVSNLKYSFDRDVILNSDFEKKEQKPKVGKLNLDLWNKQVQDNKQLIGKGKTIESSENKTQIQKITTTKMTYEKTVNGNEVIKRMESQSELKTVPSDLGHASGISKIDVPELSKEIIKSQERSEMPTILPIRRDFKSSAGLNEIPKLLPGRINLPTSEGQLRVPVVLPETPLTSKKLSFESQKSHIEIPVSVSYTTEVKTNIYTAEISGVTRNANISKDPKFLSQDVTANHSFEVSRSAPEKIEIILDETNFEEPKILPEQIQLNTPEEEDVLTTKEPISDKSEVYTSNKVEQSNEKLHRNSDVDDLDIEIPSDPELVDSEPEMRDTKDTIMGKLKNKIFLLTNRKSNKNKLPEKTCSPTDSVAVDDRDNNEIHPAIDENSALQDKDEIRNEFKLRHNKSMHDFQVEYKTREDIKRTKSLAELDLGDAVKGQVRRMVYRIKSEDFDKIETPRTRKISLREMPKKSSVLEKIMLFEGKANAETVKRPINIISTNKTLNQPSINQTLAEEVYLRKIEDLSTVKMRYNRTDMLYLNLGNGDQMPAIALGTALLDHRLAVHIVTAAIDLGYRAIDTAFIYGTERLVGQGIKNKIDDGTVTREELFIMGKLWSSFHKPDLVETACRASLEALGLDYFDLYMIHNPMSLKEGGDAIPTIANVLQFSQYDYLDAWFAMETLVSKGLVKTIGVSNFNSQQIQKILDKGHIRPVVNQVECHPYLTQQPLETFCKERNITLSCFAVLGSKGSPIEYKTGVAAAIDDPLIKVMASGLNVTPAQLLVRYQIQSGRQAVVKASSPGHLYDILQALTFVLEPHQIQALNALNRTKRIFDMKMLGELHKNYPFNVPF